jgi:hypothetical protein
LIGMVVTLHFLSFDDFCNKKNDVYEICVCSMP